MQEQNSMLHWKAATRQSLVSAVTSEIMYLICVTKGTGLFLMVLILVPPIHFEFNAAKGLFVFQWFCINDGRYGLSTGTLPAFEF